MDDLFTPILEQKAPLADRMRPRTLDEFLGQEHIVGPGKLLRRAIEVDRLTSSIFYGPPGTGKTTLAHIIAGATRAAFEKLNAVTSGVADVRRVIEEADSNLRLYGRPTYLLLDECHRWSKAQSDSILPAIEKGVIRFIGSTTENPMIAMTPAIVSRCRLFEFRHLTAAQVREAMERALCDEERGLGRMRIEMDGEALDHLASVANGDARSALNALELAALTTPPGEGGVIRVTIREATESIQQRVIQCDESYYYDMLSAFCKSLRGSDSDAALSWFARLIHAGVDPRVIVRRLIAHASEDVGLAAPGAMEQAVAAGHALEMVGMPEAGLSLTQAIIFLCESPKSNSVVVARDSVFRDAEHDEHHPVPVHLRDTSYAGAQRLGAGKGYLYPHNYPGHYIKQEYAPVSARGKRYYHPSQEGFEKRIRELRALRGISDEGKEPENAE
ncbi:MAG: replication-associated recombination protein A [Clostridiales bacterium]|nr:replication-associated recombination protein A [Clostridiales bacterium]